MRYKKASSYFIKPKSAGPVVCELLAGKRLKVPGT